jgi:hypothetical protein
MHPIRFALVVATVVGLLVLPVDWEALPMTYPIFAFLPGWIFSTPGLLFIIMTLAYAHSEYRNVRKWLKFRWLNPADASSYLYTRLNAEGLGDETLSMDVYHREIGSGNFPDAAMGWLTDGVNDGKIPLRGRPENGAAIIDVPLPLRDHGYSKLQRELRGLGEVGADNRVYRDLQFGKAGIRRYAKSLRRITAQEQREREVKLKDARTPAKLEAFIKEHESDPKGDAEKLDALIKRPVRESGSEVPPASRVSGLLCICDLVHAS